jgi:hypothetical protein
MQYFRQFVKYSQIFVLLSLNLEDGQSTSNTRLRRFRVAVVAAENQCITYSEFVSAALVIQYRHGTRRFVICDLSESALLLRIFGKALPNIQWVFWFPLQMMSE